MNVNEIRLRQRQRPFRPFAVLTSDGNRYEVKHPENLHVVKGGLLYIFNPIEDDDADYEFPPISVTLHHVTAIEPLPEKAA